MNHIDDKTSNTEKIGRNDPCPCGSGKKYKHCCYGKQESGVRDRIGMNSLMAEIRRTMQDKEFGSLEEAQTFFDTFIARKNRSPCDDFQGISPNQMHQLLDFAFSSPELVTFSRSLAKHPEAPVMHLFNLLLAAIGEKGLKTTAKGNLPVKFMRQVADEYFSEENKLLFEIYTETDFFDIHVTRLLGGIAGFISKYRGRFIMTTRLRKLLAQGGIAAAYLALFQAFVQKYNWAYRDGYPDFQIIQQSFAFSLYLFHRFGDEWRPSSFYADCFIKAFPAILAEAESQLTYTTPENIVSSCYSIRCLESFAVFFGLMDIKYGERNNMIGRKFKLKKTDLLDEVVTFHF